MKNEMDGKVPPPLTPPHKGEGVVHAGAQWLTWMLASGARPSNFPSPSWGGVRGGGRVPTIAMEHGA